MEKTTSGAFTLTKDFEEFDVLEKNLLKAMESTNKARLIISDLFQEELELDDIATEKDKSEILYSYNRVKTYLSMVFDYIIINDESLNNINDVLFKKEM